eukprot:COSAG04_NODE_4499_length_2050_cov_3.859935_2_plen_178_part_00
MLACTLESVEARAWLAPYLRQRESSCTSRCGAVARRAAGALAARADAPVVAEPSHRVEQVPSPAELAAQASRLSCCTRARLAPAERKCCAGQRGRAALRSRSHLCWKGGRACCESGGSRQHRVAAGTRSSRRLAPPSSEPAQSQHAGFGGRDLAGPNESFRLCRLPAAPPLQYVVAK